jgi:DNA adenine methylase
MIFRDVLAAAEPEDVIYMDPPYQGTSGERDSAVIWPDCRSMTLWPSLDQLNAGGLRYIISYDGRTGDKSYGEPLPAYLRLTKIELEAGRSSQATLLGREEATVESLYLSPALSRRPGRCHPK